MRVKRFWPSTRLGLATLVTYGLVIALAVGYTTELIWGLQAFPRYAGVGRWKGLAEIRLSQQAAAAFYEQRNPQRARHYAERALAIDPNLPEARYIVAASHYQVGEYVRSLAELARVIERDPTLYVAYVLTARIYAETGDRARARAVLEQGMARLRTALADYQPRPDPDSASHFNAKAAAIHAKYQQDLQALEHEIQALGLAAGPKVDRE